MASHRTSYAQHIAPEDLVWAPGDVDQPQSEGRPHDDRAVGEGTAWTTTAETSAAQSSHPSYGPPTLAAACQSRALPEDENNSSRQDVRSEDDERTPFLDLLTWSAADLSYDYEDDAGNPVRLSPGRSSTKWQAKPAETTGCVRIHISSPSSEQMDSELEMYPSVSGDEQEDQWVNSDSDTSNAVPAARTASNTLFVDGIQAQTSEAGLRPPSTRSMGKGKRSVLGAQSPRGRVNQPLKSCKPPTSSNEGGSSTMFENNRGVSSDPMSPGWRSFKRTKSITDMAAQLEVMQVTGMGRNGQKKHVRAIHNTKTGIRATIDFKCWRLDSTDHLTGKAFTFQDKNYRDAVRDMLYCGARFRHLNLQSALKHHEGRLHLISNAVLVSCGQSETTMSASRLANLTEEFCRQQMAREKSCQSKVLSLQVIRPRYRTDTYMRKAREVGPSVQADDVTLFHVARS